MKNKGVTQIVTEIGAFGSLNINDPTAITIEAEDKSLEDIVKEVLDEDEDK